MSDDSTPTRPIGWWLSEAGASLDAAFERCLEDREVDRRGWQVLASLARRPVSHSEIVKVLASFDSPVAVDEVVGDLISRGWVEESAGLLRLTRAGEREQTALKPLIDNVRLQVTRALPGDDYVTLIRLLEQLIDGLR